MLKSIFCFSMFLLVYTLTAKCQAFDKLIGEQDWHITQTLDGFVTGHDEETFALYEIPKEGFGILLINSKGQIKWKTALKEKPFQMARVANNIAIITGDRTGFSAGTNNVNAVLVNPENGKILLQKNINNASNSVLIIPKIYPSDSGNFLKVGLRYSNTSRGVKVSFFGIGANKTVKDANQVNKFEILSIDKDLQISNKQSLSFSSASDAYAGSDMDDEGNIFYAGYNEDRNDVTVYKFADGKSTADKKITINVNVKKFDYVKETQLLAGKQKTSTAYFAIRFKNEDKEFIYEIDKLDLNAGTKITVADVLDKKYRKELEAQTINKFKEIAKPDIDNIDDLTLTKIIEAGDKLIVCKDIQLSNVSGNDNTVMYTGGNGIVSVYDASLKKLYERIVPKKYKSYLPLGLGIDLHVKDGNAYFVTNNSEGGYMNADVLFGKMEINSGNIIFIEHLEKDQIGKAEPADLKNIIWYKDKFIVSYMKLKGMLSWAYTNVPAIYKY